jgi:ElaB/YqjD/DUF883 family membrane-anchored ribosome-binding protein
MTSLQKEGGTIMPQVAEAVNQPIHQMRQRAAALAEAFDEGIEIAKRVGKHTSDAAEELMQDTQERIKRRPAETVVMAFTAGFLAGGLVSWMTRLKK